MQQVATAGHPQHLFLGVNQEVGDAVRANVCMKPEELVIHRFKWFGLAMENDQILRCMPDDMRSIMKTKRIALLRRIIADEAYPDQTLADDLARGFDLVGELPQAGGVLPPKLVPATLVVLGCLESAASYAVIRDHLW